MKPVDDFGVVRVIKVESETEGIVTLVRNDKIKVAYKKVINSGDHPPHLIPNESGKLAPTDLLKRDPEPPLLFIKRESILERYERVKENASQANN